MAPPFLPLCLPDSHMAFLISKSFQLFLQDIQNVTRPHHPQGNQPNPELSWLVLLFPLYLPCWFPQTPPLQWPIWLKLVKLCSKPSIASLLIQNKTQDSDRPESKRPLHDPASETAPDLMGCGAPLTYLPLPPGLLAEWQLPSTPLSPASACAVTSRDAQIAQPLTSFRSLQ